MRSAPDIKRFLTLFKNYSAYDFCTHRTNEYLQDSDYYFKIEDIILGEIFRSYMFAIRGKSKFIDCLYLARGIHRGIDHPTRSEWVAGENWQSSYNELIIALSNVLSNKDKLSLTKSNNEVKLAVERLISLDIDNVTFIFTRD